MPEATYNTIAEEYKESKNLAYRHFLEEHSLFSLAGELRGKKVLDLACGEGFYSRKLMERGADSVFAVDLSEEMIHLAKEEECKNPLGIKYLASDVSQMGVVGSFDMVFAAYLLNYAQSEEQLHNFCQTIYSNLEVGGSFISINDNPAQSLESYHLCKKYGFNKTSPEIRKEGSPITYTMYLPDGSVFSFDNFYLSPQTYERVFKDCGFQSFSWHPIEVSPQGLVEYESGFWNELVKHQPFVCLKAVK